MDSSLARPEQRQATVPPAPGVLVRCGLGQLVRIGDEARGEPAGTATQVHLVQRETFEVDAGAPGQSL